ncbi:MAG: molybdopterin-dependent oxidoreductase [Kordiimonadaceae bacterium]|nr:molybdopterin-dependent oxidoreductase [Kordiimonadaceae bacterium]
MTAKNKTTVKTTTCYMCACRCGINVHLQDGRLRYIEGNPDHPVNKGVLCAKGSAGIMQHYSPARLTTPLKRVGPRGSGEFEEISWEEAMEIATGKLRAVREKDPKRLAFFTGRDQSQALTGWFSAKFGTHNYAAHGGFCSVNMAAAGLYTIGGSFWEFGEPDWHKTKYFMMFGVAEDHDSNPIKKGISTIKLRKGTKYVSVNPVQSGYAAIADEWLGIRPGTDGLFIGAIIAQLLKAEKIDWDFLIRYTNSPWLVIDNPGAANNGLFARDGEGNPLCYDQKFENIKTLQVGKSKPALVGDYKLDDGTKVVPAFYYIIQEFLGEKYDTEEVSKRTGIVAFDIERIAAELAEAAFADEENLNIPWTDSYGNKHKKTVVRPVSFHAMRGIAAHKNGFETCRMLHLLQMLLGAIDRPGSFRYKPPFPRPTPPHKKMAKQAAEPNGSLSLEPLGFPAGPEDLAVDEKGEPTRLDKAFSWEYPLAIHGMMHMVLHNAWAGDPYKIDVLMMYMANMAWNSSMNVGNAVKYMTDKDPETGDYKIPYIIYSDAFYSETVPYADLILPDTTYLERWDAISMLDRPIGTAEAAADSIRQPVVEPDRNVRPFQDVVLDLGARLGLPGMVDDKGEPLYPGGYSDYLTQHERAPGVGPLSGWRGEDGLSHGKGAPNKSQLNKYIENGCFWEFELDEGEQYNRFANKAYLETATKMGWIGAPEPIVLNVYNEMLQKFHLAAEGHGENVPPEHARERIRKYFNPVPTWYPVQEQVDSNSKEYPITALTQRPPHMYHSWGGQNAWLRQITAQNYLYVNSRWAKRRNIGDLDWVWVKSPHGEVKVQAKYMDGLNEGTVWTWNAIGKRRGAWALDENSPEFKKAFLLNHVISENLRTDTGEIRSNSDPVTGQGAWFDTRVKVERAEVQKKGQTSPLLDPVKFYNKFDRPVVMNYGFKKEMPFEQEERSLGTKKKGAK